MKHCTNKKCNKTWPDEFNLCPVCGGELVVEQTQPSDTISMGDGTAINGGVTISKDDNHSTSSSFNTSHSHNHTTNIITENIYHGPIPTKTKEDLIHEKEIQFREHCKKVLADGILTHEDRVWLEEQRLLLDLPEDMAQHILKKLRNINKRPTVMTMAQRIQLDNFKKVISGNMIESIKNQMPNIQVIASKIQDEELHYLNYMVLAALEPNEIIRLYDDSVRIEDNYWLTYWTYVAYQKIGNRLKAENVFLELAKWNDCKPHEDIELVAILGHLILKEKEIASEIFVRTINGAYSPILSSLSDVISVILFYDIDDVNKNKLLTQNKFYIEHFLKEFSHYEIDAARVAKEKMLAQKEAEEKALLQAEKTIKEAEEQMRHLAVERDKFKQECDLHNRKHEEYTKALDEQKEKLKQESNLLTQERHNFEIESQQKYTELKEKEEKLLAIHNTNIESQRVLEQQSKSIEEERQEIEIQKKSIQEEQNKLNELSRNLAQEREMHEQEHKRHKYELDALTAILNEQKKELENEHSLLKIEQQKNKTECKRLQEEEREKISNERKKLEQDYEVYKKKMEDSQKLTTKIQNLQSDCGMLETRKNELQNIIRQLEKHRQLCCPICGTIASNDALYCRHCGTKFRNI